MYRQLYNTAGIASLRKETPSIKYDSKFMKQASAPDPMADLKDRYEDALINGSIPKTMSFEQFIELLREQSKSGIMDAVPREQALLGGLKKAVKSVTKGIGDLVSSDLGKAALIGAGAYYGIPALTGKSWGTIGSSLMSKLPSFAMPKLTEGIIGKGATLLAGSALMTKLFGSPTEAAQMYSQRPEAVTSYLRDYYRQVNPKQEGQSDEEYEQQVADFVTRNTAEYRTSDTFAVGGRVGFKLGTDYKSMKEDNRTKVASSDAYVQRVEYYISQGYSYAQASEMAFNDMKDGYSIGGRVKYAMGDTAQTAAGIEGLPYRQNPAGVGEIDLRDSGGFIPPVGVKEKADDIPAMLSNNEFVFTADAVRGMGNGDVNVGAQRMYDMMKKLENGGRV